MCKEVDDAHSDGIWQAPKYPDVPKELPPPYVQRLKLRASNELFPPIQTTDLIEQCKANGESNGDPIEDTSVSG